MARLEPSTKRPENVENDIVDLPNTILTREGTDAILALRRYALHLEQWNDELREAIVAADAVTQTREWERRAKKYEQQRNAARRALLGALDIRGDVE